MNTLTLFTLEVLLCLSISAVIIWLIKPLLREILVETCGTATRAEFWVMFTQLMVIISPLLIVIFFAPTESAHTTNLAEAMQDTLFRSLLGVFVALAAIGQVMWQSVRDATKITSKPSDEKTAEETAKDKATGWGAQNA